MTRGLYAPPARLEIKAKLRLQVVDLRSHIADVNLKIALRTRACGKSHTSGRIAVSLMRLVVVFAVIRKDKFLTLTVDQSTLHKESRQVGLKRLPSQRRIDSDVNVALRA